MEELFCGIEGKVRNFENFQWKGDSLFCIKFIGDGDKQGKNGGF